MGIGLLDVAMNAQAAEVENGYRRPVMAAFHAGWSVSAVAGAAAGGLAIRAGWPMSRAVALGAGLVGLLTPLARRGPLPPARPPPRPAPPVLLVTMPAQAPLTFAPASAPIPSQPIPAPAPVPRGPAPAPAGRLPGPRATGYRGRCGCSAGCASAASSVKAPP